MCFIGCKNKSELWKHKIATHQKNELPKSKHCGIIIANSNHPGNLKKQGTDFHNIESLGNFELYFHPDIM